MYIISVFKKNIGSIGIKLSNRISNISESKRLLVTLEKISRIVKLISKRFLLKTYSKNHLNVSRLNYKTIFESANDAIIIFEPSTEIILSANSKALEIYGFKKEEFIGMSLKKLIKDNLREEEQIKKLMETGKYRNFESIHFNSKGEELNMLINSSVIEYKGNKAVLSINRDMTELKQIESKLHSINKMLNSIIEKSPSAIVVLDLQGKIEIWNPAAERLFGWKKDEVIGKKYPRILEGKEDEAFDLFLYCINEGKLTEVETSRIKKNVTIIEVAKAATIISGPSGIDKRMLIILNDITDRKKTEIELINAKEKAQESDRMKTEFLAQMSHEIRTPINAILSFISLIKEEVSEKIDDDLKVGFNAIDSGAQRLIRTIDLILNMSQIQNGYYDIHFQSTDLVKDVLELIVKQFSSAAKAKNVNINLIDVEGSYKINIDKYTVSQIFINLIDNAIKFTNHGDVKISVYNNSSNQICVNVIDSGIGISKIYLKELFKPFSQEDSGYTRSYDGTGLGLALVKKYCEMNNADIKIESEKGKGSVFSVIFNQ